MTPMLAFWENVIDAYYEGMCVHIHTYFVVVFVELVLQYW